MTSHRDELRAELVAAAERRAAKASKRSGRVRHLAVVSAGCVALAIVATMVAVSRGGQPAAAEVFEVRRNGDEVTVKVIAEIRDPDRAKAELDRIGLEAELVPAPTPPWLVDVIVGADATAGLADIEIVDGRVTSMYLPDGRAELTIYYGRPAAEDEVYEASASTPDCGEFARRPAADVLAEIASRHGPRFRVQRISGPGAVEITRAQLGRDDLVIDTLPLSASQILVVVSDENPLDESLICPT